MKAKQTQKKLSFSSERTYKEFSRIPNLRIKNMKNMKLEALCKLEQKSNQFNRPGTNVAKIEIYFFKPSGMRQYYAYFLFILLN